MTPFIAWIALLCLLAAEVIATLSHAGWLAGILAPLMIALVAIAFMKLLKETPLSRIFAFAGLFWLAVLIGLGGIDFAVRRNVPVEQITIRAG